jgi:hypothetical protein
MIALASPVTDLVDDVLVTYHDWREEADAVADAYDTWRGAPPAEEGRRFAAYTAALEQEENAANAYSHATTTLEQRMPLAGGRSTRNESSKAGDAGSSSRAGR